MKGAKPCLLTINGGSSSIKFALFEADGPLLRLLDGAIDRIGLPDAMLRVKGLNSADNFSRPVAAPDHAVAAGVVLDCIVERGGRGALIAAGHRVVHGGPEYSQPQRITPEMVADLRALSPFDPDHLPEEILLIEALRLRFPELPQVACFDTAFHHDLPRVARLLPIPRRYEAQGVRRYGFHGLSYAFLMEELGRREGIQAARGRVVLAHLGNGASLSAVHDGKPIDTSMSFTPASGVPMSTRSGDLDPGLVSYLARTGNMSAKQFDEMVNFQSGLLGISETSPDMRDLLGLEKHDFAGSRRGRDILLPDQKMDWRVRGGAGRYRYARIRRRHWRERAAGSRANLRWAGVPRNRNRPGPQYGERAADLTGRRPGRCQGHPYRRGAHDCEIGRARARS